MNAERYIAELLHEHDCVIVPGFGGFIGNYQHAMIHPVNHTFIPPSKSLLFNVNLTKNDGLLASRIVVRENISYDKAMDVIGELVESWNRHLREHRFLMIEMIGNLTQNSEGSLQFEQDNSLNFLTDSFGLASFVSPAIRRTEFQEKMEKKISRYMEAPKEKRRLLPRPLKWAAVLILPIGMATYFGITNFHVIRNLTVDYSGLFYSAPAPAPSHANAPPKTIYIHSSKPTVSAKEVTTPEKKVVTPAVTPVKETEAPAADQQVKPFSVIVGAFRMHENADKLVSDLRKKGFDALIIDTTRTGLYRVSIGNCKNRDKALQLLASVRSGEFASAWLLAR